MSTGSCCCGLMWGCQDNLLSDDLAVEAMACLFCACLSHACNMLQILFAMFASGRPLLEHETIYYTTCLWPCTNSGHAQKRT